MSPTATAIVSPSSSPTLETVTSRRTRRSPRASGTSTRAASCAGGRPFLMTFLVTVAAVHQGVLAEHVVDRAPQRLATVDHDRLLGVEAAASRPGRLPSCSPRSAIPVVSPRAASRASTARRRCSPRPPKDRAVRHRYNPGGNRRVNAILHRMAVTQLRCEPRAQAIYAQARSRGHTKKEARRILKRHLSDVIHRRMMRDLAAQPPEPSRGRPRPGSRYSAPPDERP
jgi:hypothetical protein